MAWIALVRHGLTRWNELGLIQGRIDTPLSDAGVAELQQTRPSEAFLRARWVTSPLRRAVQTAAILNPDTGTATQIQPALIEANWGDFEGLRRDELPRRIRDLALTPSRGLDFRPPAGESPRMVQARLLAWLAMITAEADNGSGNPATPVVAVTHKGVIRSALSAACGWDMSADFGEKTDWTRPHIFRIDVGGALRLACLNCPWEQPARRSSKS